MTRVITDRGKSHAGVVVSTVDIIRTHHLLEKVLRLEWLEPSLSGFVLLLGLQGHTPQLAHHTAVFPKDYRAGERQHHRSKDEDRPDEP